MSDILIRGIELPRDITLLAISQDGTVDIISGQPDLSWKTLKHKAISVPPQGRLGDLDALAGQFTPDDLYYPTEEDRRDYDNHNISMRDVREVIEMAPTIIPADQI